MSEITLSAADIGKLREIDGPATILSPEGEIVGVFTPAAPLDDIDREVLERIRKNRGKPQKTYTTQEVLEHLKRLGG